MTNDDTLKPTELAPPAGNEDDTSESIAALEFEPIDTAALIADLTEPACTRMMQGLAVSLRLAAAIVGKTKPELVESTGALLDDGEVFEQLVCNLDDAAKHLTALAEIVNAASARTMVAAEACGRASQHRAPERLQ